jgi:hypothetical protein
MKKNSRRVPAIDAPATRLGGSAGSSLSRSLGGFSRSYAESPTSALPTSSSGTLRIKPSQVRLKLGERPCATRASSHSSAKLWSLVTRRGISEPLVNEAAPDIFHRMNPDSAVKPKMLEARCNPGAAKASDCEISKLFCALARRCYEA